MKKAEKQKQDVGGRPSKPHDERCRSGRMTIALPPPVADRVRREAKALELDYSAFVRMIIVREFHRIDQEKISQKVDCSL